MKLWTKPFYAMPALAIVMLAAPQVSRAQFQGAPIKNLRVPLDHFESGAIRMQVTAATALMRDDGKIEASGVKIEMYTEEGGVESVVEAQTCLVDRDNELVTSESPVHFQQDGLEISGEGFEWQAADQSFKIEHNAKVVFARKVLDLHALGH